MFARFQPYLPWLSLASGLVSALVMDRRPERAWLVAMGAAMSWLAFFAFQVMARLQAAGIRHWSVRASSFLLRLGSQSGVQLLLFFVMPLYMRAAAPCWGHALFIALLLLAASCTLWDPWHMALLHRPYWGALLQAFATFAGLNAVLPIFGLANGQALVASATCTALSLPLTAWFATQQGRIWHLLGAGAAAFALLGMTQAGMLRYVVPAAPLRLTEAAMGTRVRGLELIDPQEVFTAPPTQMICWTRIWAPSGLHDGLFHVWSLNGLRVDRIPLAIHGGQEFGFRTWSVKQHLGGQAGKGDWRCDVETAEGQILGGTTARVL